MGRKVHPVGFRIGIIRDWQAKWYSDRHYADFLHEDLKLRRAIESRYSQAGISLVEIDREANGVLAIIHTARPGVVIGRGGQRVDEMRHYLERLIGKRVQLNILEIQQPELDAYLVARTVAEQFQRRIAYRRAMKQAIFRTIQAGAKGIRISCAGRLGGAEIARRQTMHEGQVPLHTLRADIDYGFAEARTTLGRIGIKVWIYKGDILPESKVEEVKEEVVEPVAEVSVKEEVVEPVAEVSVKEEVVEPVAEVSEAKKVTKPKAAKPAAKVSEAKKVTKPKAAKPAAKVSEVRKVTKPKAAKLAAKVSEAKKVTKPKAAKLAAKVSEAKKVTKPKAANPKITKSVADVSTEEKDVTTETGEVSQDS